MLKTANFGRKQYGGKCIPENVGPIGCYEDVSEYIDILCTGKSECTFLGADSNLIASNPCSAVYSPYLEISYDCITGKVFCLDLILNDYENNQIYYAK